MEYEKKTAERLFMDTISPEDNPSGMDWKSSTQMFQVKGRMFGVTGQVCKIVD